jgi:autotransporter-associated beta strand protein
LTLTGTSTSTGSITVSAGTLRLGASFAAGFVPITTSGSIEYANGVNIQNPIILASNGVQLRVAGGAAATQAVAISGAQPLEKTGQGTLTLSAINTYSGVTTVSAGTLNVTGALSNSTTSVANGGALTGTGSVRNVAVASGGTVGPSGTGTLTVQGNLTLNAGATYADSITPSTAGLTNVSGSASLNGTAAINAGTGTYTVGQRYTLVTATGGVSGSFSSLSVSNLPGYVKGRLGYDATNAYLYLDPNAITPLLPSGASLNQTSLAAGIDAGLQQGTVLNSGFTALFNLQGAALGNALNQIAGQGAPNIATAGGQSLTPFLSVMQGQGAFGGNGAGTAANFAPGNVYGATDAPRRAQLAPGAMRVWGSVYGGHTGISANASGAASLSASNVGFIAGAEVSLTDDFRLGGSAGFGSQDFSSANSMGDSDDVMLGLYARHDILESGYIAAAFGYSWHDISTTRTITVAGTDILGAKFDAHAIGGRLEGGWRLAVDDGFGLTPFFAFAGDNFYAPAYAESVISGTSDFALSYAANKTGQKHTEFGAHLDHAIDLGGGDMLSADARAAWAHQLDDAPFVTATFQGLPGSTFRLLGVRAATDTALLGLGLKIQGPDGLDVGLRMDSQVGAGTTVLQGMGTVSWRW